MTTKKRTGRRILIYRILACMVLFLVVPALRADARTIKMTGKTIVLQKGESVTLRSQGMQKVTAWSSDKENIARISAESPESGYDNDHGKDSGRDMSV